MKTKEQPHLKLFSDVLHGLTDEKYVQMEHLLNDEQIRQFLLDHELVETVEKFFENNLNVCQTSKKTFMHRNTLLYRIEKVKKILGLDVRKFEDAITIKIILSLNEIVRKWKLFTFFICYYKFFNVLN